METTEYAADLQGKTPVEVLAVIQKWRDDATAGVGAAADLLSAIESYLVSLPIYQTEAF